MTDSLFNDEMRPIDVETILLALDFFRDNMSPALPEAHKVITSGAIDGARARFVGLPQVAPIARASGAEGERMSETTVDRRPPQTERDRVWTVASGYYSDYQVHAVFHSRAAAERAAELRSDDDYTEYRVESLLFCGEGDEPAEMVTSYSLVQEFRDDGSYDEPQIGVRIEPWFDQLWETGPRPRIRFVRAPVHKGKGGRLEVRGTDQAAVMKAATDHKAILLVHCDQTGKVGPVRDLADYEAGGDA